MPPTLKRSASTAALLLHAAVIASPSTLDHPDSHDTWPAHGEAESATRRGVPAGGDVHNAVLGHTRHINESTEARRLFIPHVNKSDITGAYGWTMNTCMFFGGDSLLLKHQTLRYTCDMHMACKVLNHLRANAMIVAMATPHVHAISAQQTVGSCDHCHPFLPDLPCLH
jgi:hypothetical protein